MSIGAHTYGGIDPSGRIMGIGAVRESRGRLEVVHLARPVVLTGHPLPARFERVRAAVRETASFEVWNWVIEQPPPTARADTGHVRQAPIGFSLGLCAGLAAAVILEHNADAKVELVEPTPWRASMFELASMYGVALRTVRERLAEPEPERPQAQRGERTVQRTTSGQLVVSYPCGHSSPPSTLERLMTSAPHCPKCLRLKVEPDRAKAVREAWKAVACDFVRLMWPQAYQKLRESLRSRESTPDHRRAGLSDACEALGLAAHGWLHARR